MIEKQYLAYYDKNNGEILSLQRIEMATDLNIEESILLFKEFNNYSDKDIGMKFFSFDDYNKLYEPDFYNFFYVDTINDKIKCQYSSKPSSSEAFLWYEMDPQRQYTKEQVLDMYLNDYLNCNLKNCLKHPDKFFSYKFLSLNELTLRDDVMSRNWDTYFKDPYLSSAAGNKLKLAESIMDIGTYYPIQVVKNDDCSTYEVREGNHRIASLKLGQIYGIVPKGYKICCIISEPLLYSKIEANIKGVLSEPLTYRYNIDALWGVKGLNDIEFQNRIYKNILEKNEILINDYTAEAKGVTIQNARNAIYIYPLFLRDLFHFYRDELKPAKFLNNEQLFEEWIKE